MLEFRTQAQNLSFEKFRKCNLCNSYRKLFKQIYVYINYIFLIKFLKTKKNTFVFKVRLLKFCGNMNSWRQKNPDQIDNSSLSRHLCSVEYQKLLKTVYFKTAAAFPSFIQSY